MSMIAARKELDKFQRTRERICKLVRNFAHAMEDLRNEKSNSERHLRYTLAVCTLKKEFSLIRRKSHSIPDAMPAFPIDGELDSNLILKGISTSDQHGYDNVQTVLKDHQAMLTNLTTKANEMNEELRKLELEKLELAKKLNNEHHRILRAYISNLDRESVQNGTKLDGDQPPEYDCAPPYEKDEDGMDSVPLLLIKAKFECQNDIESPDAFIPQGECVLQDSYKSECIDLSPSLSEPAFVPTNSTTTPENVSDYYPNTAKTNSIEFVFEDKMSLTRDKRSVEPPSLPTKLALGVEGMQDFAEILTCSSVCESMTCHVDYELNTENTPLYFLKLRNDGLMRIRNLEQQYNARLLKPSPPA
jgi:hypothetical protein